MSLQTRGFATQPTNIAEQTISLSPCATFESCGQFCGRNEHFKANQNLKVLSGTPQQRIHLDQRSYDVEPGLEPAKWGSVGQRFASKPPRRHLRGFKMLLPCASARTNKARCTRAQVSCLDFCSSAHLVSVPLHDMQCVFGFSLYSH